MEAANKYVCHLETDVSVDMRKLENYENEAIDDGKKAEKLVRDVYEISEDWQKILTSSAFITSEFPTLVDAIHQCEYIASNCESMTSGNIVEDVATFVKDGDVERMDKTYTDLNAVYEQRQKYMHSLIAIERWTKNLKHIVTQTIIFCDRYDKKAEEKTKFVERMKEEEKSLVARMKGMKSKVLHSYNHNHHRSHLHHILKAKKKKTSSKTSLPNNAVGSNTVNVVKVDPNRHISMKDEADKLVSSMDEDSKLIVKGGENLVQYVEENQSTFEAFFKDAKSMKTDWKPSLQAIASLQSIIPLVNKALSEVKAIADLVRDSFGAAALNPSSIIAMIEDGKKAFDDADAIYEVGEKIKGVLDGVEVLGAFLKATGQLVSTGRALTRSFPRLTGGKGNKEALSPALLWHTVLFALAAIVLLSALAIARISNT